MDLLQKNIEWLSVSQGHSIAPIDEQELSLDFIAQDQEAYFFADGKGKIYELKHEVDSYALPDESKQEFIIILGIGGVREIEKMLACVHPKTLVLIIEPNKSFFYHAIQNQDLTFLADKNARIFVQDMATLEEELLKLFSSETVMLVSNLKIYATYYYRTYGIKTYRDLVRMVGEKIKYMLFTLGNDIEDSLIGLKHNIHNIRYLRQSKDIGYLKNRLQGYPLIVVSAGPSLEKNIAQLKYAQGKAVIIAVDTICQRLLKEGIRPDIICSIERIREVYEYFYKGKKIPDEIALLAPPVIVPEIFEEYKGTLLLPMRKGVREYQWLDAQILNLGDASFVNMGISVANLAFGFAAHVGASPIILVGQDLAYSQDGQRTHSSGTIYDKNDFGMLELQKIEVDGYYGGKVYTQKTWFDFKVWFQTEILRENLTVVNATEGGARIEGTVQMPLQQAIEMYCTRQIDFAKTIKEVPLYNIDSEKVQHNLNREIDILETFQKDLTKYERRLKKIKLDKTLPNHKLMDIVKKMQRLDEVLPRIYSNDLLFHILQPYIINVFHRFYKIPNTLTYESVSQNLDIQEEFITVIRDTINRIVGIIREQREA